MRLHFDSNQQYQLEAINAVLRVFDGQPAKGSNPFPSSYSGEVIIETGFANRLHINEEQILQNVQAIQKEALEKENQEQRKHGKWTVSESLDEMHFSVEMETGTGKTYVYLRTIYELNRKYGFRKFVIVVPSIAIREGVLKNLSVTHDHLQNLYGNPPTHYEVYDSSRVAGLRAFALSDAIEILVINIDSFAKDKNIINRPNDKLMGNKPIDFVKCANPVVILDEPQNMETDIRRKAIQNLNYLCTLRYSATHTKRYNMIYNLDPVQAYDLGLVKQIEVSSVVSKNDFNNAYVRLKKITNTARSLSALIEIHRYTRSGIQRKSVNVRVGKDLYDYSGRREVYRDNYTLNGIDADKGSIVFSGGKELSIGETMGGLNDEIMRAQIYETVSEHFSKEKRLNGVKVISLFFIDRVANYRAYDEAGNPVKGKFAEYFEEAFNHYSGKEEYLGVIPFEVEKVHDGYFSQDRGRWKDTRGNSRADNRTFKLIMREKERLLDPNEPLRFIFSHSALREGWDNPNVFQICTLNETQSELKKRQEIGRGMRLAVDSDGKRIRDTNVNLLTVIANESYEEFARQLQNEIEDECGVMFENRLKNKRKRASVRYRKGFQLDGKFKALWGRIKYRTVYRVEYDTDELIGRAIESVKKMDAITKPMLKIEKGKMDLTVEGVKHQIRKSREYTVRNDVFFVPDILSYIQDHSQTRLTRSTIYKILSGSGRMGEILINPQLFGDSVVKAIQDALTDLMVSGIKYEKISEKEYALKLFEKYEFHRNEHTFQISNPNKTINASLIPLESGVENRFAKDCESSEDVEFYFKLPPWFKIKTPIGNYNPDWALIKRDEKVIYFIAETKSSGQELRTSEKYKIACGEANCKVLGNVEFRQVSFVSDLDQRSSFPPGRDVLE